MHGFGLEPSGAIRAFRAEPERTSYDTAGPDLKAALRTIAPRGVLVGHRFIRPGDEEALLPEERTAFRQTASKVARQSGAARIVARDLLAVRGFHGVALPRSGSGAPVWPHGVVGSLAHDEEVAVAAVANSQDFSALGIDVEPADPLPPDLVRFVATPSERRRYSAGLLESRIMFVIKEAIYKALHPLDDMFLDFHDMEVDLEAGRGQTRNGQSVTLAFTLSPRVLALAFR